MYCVIQYFHIFIIMFNVAISVICIKMINVQHSTCDLYTVDFLWVHHQIWHSRIYRHISGHITRFWVNIVKVFFSHYFVKTLLEICWMIQLKKNTLTQMPENWTPKSFYPYTQAKKYMWKYKAVSGSDKLKKKQCDLNFWHHMFVVFCILLSNYWLFFFFFCK